MSNNPNTLQSPVEPEYRKGRAGRDSARVLLERLRSPTIESRIDATNGPFIEVGAVPSNPTGESLIDLRKIGKRLVTSNIYQPQTVETGYRHRITGASMLITHRNDAPRSRWYRPTGQEFKIVGTGENWADPVNDKIDFIGDATSLPVRDGSVGALYAAGLHPDAEPRFVEVEAPRALERGGILVLDGADPNSVADNPYFDTLRMETQQANGDREFVNYAGVRNDVPFQRPEAKS